MTQRRESDFLPAGINNSIIVSSQNGRLISSPSEGSVHLWDYFSRLKTDSLLNVETENAVP